MKKNAQITHFSAATSAAAAPSYQKTSHFEGIIRHSPHLRPARLSERPAPSPEPACGGHVRRRRAGTHPLRIPGRHTSAPDSGAGATTAVLPAIRRLWPQIGRGHAPAAGHIAGASQSRSERPISAVCGRASAPLRRRSGELYRQIAAGAVPTAALWQQQID